MVAAGRFCQWLSLYIGDWSNGMIGVSKTFGGSSILSSPALKALNCSFYEYSVLFVFHYDMLSRQCYNESGTRFMLNIVCSEGKV